MTEIIPDIFTSAWKWLAGGGAALLITRGRAIWNFLRDIYLKLDGNSVIHTQLYKTFNAKKNNTFQTACNTVYDAVGGSVSVSIAKVKNGTRMVMPDSEVNEVIVNCAGHEACKEYLGKENEHLLDQAFLDKAVTALRSGYVELRRDELHEEEYREFLEYIKASFIRIYTIAFNDDYAYFFYVNMEDDSDLSIKEKHAIRTNLKSLKSCFSKKNFKIS